MRRGLIFILLLIACMEAFSQASMQTYSPNAIANVMPQAAQPGEGDTIYLLGVGYYNPYYQEVNLSAYTPGGNVTAHHVFGYPNWFNAVNPHCLVYSDSTLYFVMVTRSPSDTMRAHFMRMTKSGTLLWERIFEINSRTSIFQLTKLDSGGFAMAGGHSLDQASYYGACLIFTDSAGNETDRKTYNSSVSCVGTSFVDIGQGEYIVGGYTTTYTQQYTYPYASGLYIKFHADGITSTKQLGEFYRDEWFAQNMLRIENEGIFVPTRKQHESWPYGGSGTGSIFNHSVPALIKMDDDLNIIWQKTLDTAYKAYYLVTKGVETNDGNLAFLGNYAEYTDSLETELGRSCLIKTDMEGNRIWKRDFYYVGTNKTNQLNDIYAKPNGEFFMCGATQDVLNVTGDQRQKMWFVTTDSYGCLVPGCQFADMKETKGNILQIGVYPNPVQDFLYVFNPLPSQNLKGKLLDLNGRAVLNDITLPASTTAIIPFYDLPQGIYIVTVLLPDGKIFSQKIIKN